MELYECEEKRGYELKCEIKLCTICKNFIENNKYLCRVIKKTGRKYYYHKSCYVDLIKYRSMIEMIIINDDIFS